MFFWRKKKYVEDEENWDFDYEDTPQSDHRKKDYYIVDQCEQIIEASRELEDARSEYRLVTSYLNDIQIIENLPDHEKEKLVETAANIVQLKSTKRKFLKIENQISENQFALIEENEEQIPEAIKRLQANEAYLDTIKRDMNYLEAEKVELMYRKNSCKKKSKSLRRLAYFELFLFVLIVFFLMILTFLFKEDMLLAMIIVAFLSTLSGAFTLLRYQDSTAELKRVDSNINRATEIENHVKIRFVNIKNAVDYVCEKYHIKNSYEFIYIWEKYNETLKKRKQQQQTDEDLEYFRAKLVRQLKTYHLYDAKVWMNHGNAIIDKKEMVELKHNLIVRRQKLRSRMEYNINVIKIMRVEIEENVQDSNYDLEPIREILNKLDKINKI